MSKPNIFKYATSELSQDAFICWLLEWAQESNANEVGDMALHDAAKQMLNAMFEACKQVPPDRYESIDVVRQYKHIDVLIIINKQYALIIEDKTGTEDHDNQLRNYWEEVRDKGVTIREDDLRFDDGRILRIYFKTGDQSNYDSVEQEGYAPFVRENMLPILRSGLNKGIKNAIYEDFLSHLENIENGIASYHTVPLNTVWDWPTWIGFFKALNETMKGAGAWRYVPNPRGGFLGFYWAWRNIAGSSPCRLFIQLEWNKICFKINVDDKDAQRRLRGEWHDLICRAAGGFAMKAGRFGKGKWMTLAVHGEDSEPADYRVAKADGTVDVNATLAKLREAEVILDRAIAEWQARTQAESVSQ